jgi:hypothetical protein
MDTMNRSERWTPVSALVFFVSFLALFFLFFVPGELPADASAAQIAEYYRGRGVGGFLLMYALVGLTGIALLWFAASLQATLRQVEPAPARLSTAAFAGGAASAILFLAGGATLLAPFTAVDMNAREALDPSLYAVVSAMGFIAINFGLLAAAVMVVAASLVALRWSARPRWFAWAGFVVAFALALNILYFFGLFVWSAWPLLASVMVLARPADRTRREGRPAVDVPSSATATHAAG